MVNEYIRMSSLAVETFLRGGGFSRVSASIMIDAVADEDGPASVSELRERLGMLCP